jgi:DNA-binding transcriptional LysR family regulator
MNKKIGWLRSGKIDVDWRVFPSFLMVMEHRSFSGAARSLGLSQPTLGRHVATFENYLGKPLFVRSKEGVSPTQDAFGILPYVKSMIDAVQGLERSIVGEDSDPAGTVRLSCSRVMACLVLPKFLGSFCESYPNIEVELLSTNEISNLMRGDADVALRMVKPIQDELVALRMGRLKVGLFAHRDYLVGRSQISSVDDLAAHVLIGPDDDINAYLFLQTKGVSITRKQVRIRSDDDVACFSLVRSAAGIGPVQVNLARKHADLVPVLEDQVCFELDVWQVMHEDLRASPRIRLFFDELAVFLRAYICEDANSV